jgi:hypothetical protein
MTSDSSVFARGFAQHFMQSLQPIPGDRRLPGAITPAFRELIEDAARLTQRPFAALGDE